MKIGKIKVQSIVNSAYASVLTEVVGAPTNLFIAGELPPTRRPTIAIIGTRRPTSYGVEQTERFASALARAGVVVVSGLALGIDSIAHAATLASNGTTLAVLANGLHRVYPATHTGLAEQIIKQGGALISEYELGEEPRKYSFLARNRIVSGIADAVLVVEAADRSGTFSTVTHAISQNKEVFAIPGPLTSLQSAGPNRLIQQGAHVALEPNDILEIIAPHLISKPTQLSLATSPVEQLILDLVATGVRDGEELLTQSKVQASEFLQAMTMMELTGSIKALGGNKWTRG